MATGLRGKLAGYGDPGFSFFLRKAFIKAMGYSDEVLDRPIVGITNTYSGFNACHRSVPEMVDAIKRGVMMAGGLPIEFPVLSIHEAFSNPTSMYLRNLMAITVEEMVRAQPMDSVVLVGGCDKTVPALLMGAASADIPAILTVTGPMLTGSHKGERLGACTDCRRLWAEHRGGRLTEAEISDIGSRLAPSAGTCAVMGTASTMAILSEVLGTMLPGGATIPATHADRLRHCEATGREAVALASSGTTLRSVLTADAFHNAYRVLQAIGGSTNALVHLAAVAGRVGIALDISEFNRISDETPVIVDLKPSGSHYMEDLHKAGGLAMILGNLRNLLRLHCTNIDGRSLGEIIDKTYQEFEQSVVRPVSDPIYPKGGLKILQGNLAPGGAVVKRAAATEALLVHTGRAVVFESVEDLTKRIDDEQLDVNKDDILVLRNAGPVGAPGMPEAGYIPIPRKLARAGVKDMVRISDARMSGTAFGTIVLHIEPESAVGGPLALVRNGDLISIDAPRGTLTLLIDEEELAGRQTSLIPEPEVDSRGYEALFKNEVLQASGGCDFRFLKPVVSMETEACQPAEHQ